LSGAVGAWPQPEKAAPDLPAGPLNPEDLEKMAVGKALAHTGGNKSRAAETLGVTRKTLAAKLKKYGMK
jgi:two-component system response regulator HydG